MSNSGRRTSFSFLSFVMALLFLVGCGGKKEKGGKITLRFIGEGTPEAWKYYEELFRIYERKHPGITIKLIAAPRSGYVGKILTMHAGGTAPDIFWLHEMLYRDLAAKGVLVDLGPYIERSDDFNIGDYFQNIVDAYRYKGKLYGFPYHFSPILLWYNKDMFDEEGLAYPDGNWTWDDFLAAARRLTKDKNGDGRTDQFGYVISRSPNRWCPFIWSNGGRMLNERGDKCLLNSPESIEGMRFYVDLMYKYHVSPTLAELRDQGTSTYVDLFLRKRVAMMSEARWIVNEARKIGDLHWDVAPLPKKECRATAIPTAGYGISAYSKHPREAWEFLKFLLGKEAQSKLPGGGIPVHIATAKERVNGHPGIPPEHDHLFLDAVDYGVLEWGIDSQAMARAREKGFALMFLGQRDVKKACEITAREANKLLREK